MERFLVCVIRGEKGNLKVGFKVENVVMSVVVEELIPAPLSGVLNGLLRLNGHDYPFFSLSKSILGGKQETGFAVVIDVNEYPCERSQNGMIAVGVDEIFGIVQGEEHKEELDFIPGISKMVDDFYLVDLCYILNEMKWEKLPEEIKRKEAIVELDESEELIAFPTNPPVAIDKDDLIGLVDLSDGMSFLPGKDGAVGVVYFMDRIIPVYRMDAKGSTDSRTIVIFKNWKALLLPSPVRKKVKRMVDYLSKGSPFKTVAIFQDDSEYFILKPNLVGEVVKR